MCPDDQLLSAHLDNEVPTPWKEQIDSILASDAECRQRFQRISTTHTILKAAAEPDFSAAQARVWSALQERTIYTPAPHRFRTISVSLPVAAVAAMAILAIGVLASFMALRAPAFAGVAADQDGLEAGLTIRAEDVEQLLRLINANEPVRQVQIELPDQSRFQFSGEPRLIRAVDHGGPRPFGETGQ